jgi:hypothetical protein
MFLHLRQLKKVQETVNMYIHPCGVQELEPLAF